MLLDIHTHHHAKIAGECIQNVTVSDFLPQQGNFYSIGIHPWDIKEGWETVYEQLADLVTHPSVIAIGEAGLDRLVSDNIPMQKAAFEKQILLSEQTGKPLIIHCVKCFNELIALKRQYHPSAPWIVHGFRNNPFIAERLMAENIYLSFGERFQTTVLQMTPMERMLTETDESNQDIRSIIQRIASAKNVPEDEFLKQLDENTQKLFFRH